MSRMGAVAARNRAQQTRCSGRRWAAEFRGHANALAVRQDRMPSRASDRDRAEWAPSSRPSWHGRMCKCSTNCGQDCEHQARCEGPENAVVLSTIHSAKGLEWDAYSSSDEQGVLPHANNDDVEEERRVAMWGLRAPSVSSA